MNQPFPAGGFGGGCEPHSGVRGRAPEANAFWQSSIEKWLKTGLWVAVYSSKSWCTKQLVFVPSYITKRKIGHSFRRLGNPPSERPRRSDSHTPAQRLPGNCLHCANISFPTQTNTRTFKSKYQTKVHKHSTLFSILYCVNSGAMQPSLHVSSHS